MGRCKSRHLDGWRIVQCRWDAEHTHHSKWHCDDSSLGGRGRIWYVKESERVMECSQPECKEES